MVKQNIQSNNQLPVAVRNQIWQVDIRPVVSIVCATFNHEKFIEEAIESFLSQKTSFPVEILIHDDASTDKTAEIVKHYEEQYPAFFKTVLQKANQFSKGLAPEWEFLFPMARGKYIALCEGDDYWTDPLKLQKQVEFLELHPDYSVCVGGYTSYIEPENRFGNTHISTIDEESSEGFTFSLEEMKQAWLTKFLTAMVRRNVLESFDATAYRHYRDVHLFYHLIKHHKAYYFKENFGVHRVHPGGIKSMKQGEVISRAEYNCYRELYEQNKDEFTRYMCLKSTLGFFNYNLFHRYEGNTLRDNLRLYCEAVLLVRNLSEAKGLFTAFFNASFKGKIKELLG